jgi:hypothetical protein
MRRLLLGLAAIACLASAQARPEAPFLDVPPCHWAAEAVAELADLHIVIGFPPDDAYSAENAFRQVFEGLRCEDPAWSLAFLAAAPAAFGTGPATLVGFSLRSEVIAREATRVRLAYELTAVLEEQGVRSTHEREGVAEVHRGDEGWRVPYDDVRALALPIFPD